MYKFDLLLLPLNNEVKLLKLKINQCLIFNFKIFLCRLIFLLLVINYFHVYN